MHAAKSRATLPRAKIFLRVRQVCQTTGRFAAASGKQKASRSCKVLPLKREIMIDFQYTQPVEKPGCALSGSRGSGVLRAEKAEKQAIEMVIPFPYRRLFQVHGSELKLHPVCYLGQASVLRITHRVFFFGVRKAPFNQLFTFLVKSLILRCILASSASSS